MRGCYCSDVGWTGGDGGVGVNDRGLEMPNWREATWDCCWRIAGGAGSDVAEEERQDTADQTSFKARKRDTTILL